MEMAAVIHKKGAPDIPAGGDQGRGSRAWPNTSSQHGGQGESPGYVPSSRYPDPMIVGVPPVVLGFEGVSEIEESGRVTEFSVGERSALVFPQSAPTARNAFTRLTS